MLRFLSMFGLMLLTSSVFAQNGVRQAYEKAAGLFDTTASLQKMDLDNKEVSDYIIMKMNSLPKRGDVPEVVIGSILKFNPGKTMEWFLDKKDQLTAAGRSNLVKSARRSNSKEAYQLVAAFLNDKTVLVDKNAAALAPYTYYDMRVCDHAFNAIGYMLRVEKKFPEGIQNNVGPDVPPEQRDQVINRFVDWWKKESPKILEKKESLSSKRPTLKAKMEAFQKAKRK